MDGLLREFEGRSLIWAIHRPEMAERFDTVVAMHQGKVVEQGSFTELKQDGGIFSKLLEAG